jgi:hypothetical protein
LGSAHLRELATLAVMQRFAEFEEGHAGEGAGEGAGEKFRRF